MLKSIFRKSLFTRWKVVLFSTILIILSTSLAAAAAGELDITFHNDGKLTTDYSGGAERAFGMAIQPDGKIVAVGTHAGPGVYDFLLVRYRTDGKRDPAFSNDGMVTTDFGGVEIAWDVVIQTDGKIVVSGFICYGDCSNYDLALARYNPNGSLDTTFSGDGKVVQDYGGGSNWSYGGIAIQPDGKIVIAGGMNGVHGRDLAVYRFNPDGTLDKTFHFDGMVNTGFGPGATDDGYDLAIKDGKIIVVGTTCKSCYSDYKLTVVRFNSNGTLDTTFNGTGKVSTDFVGNDVAYSVAILSNGKIVVAGCAYDPADSKIILARYTPSGSLDTSFHGDGKVIVNLALNRDECVYDMTIQPDGKIVVSGDVDNGTNKDFALLRFKSYGALDTTFNGNGIVTTDFGASEEGWAIALQTDGKIVVEGYTYSPYDFALARYLP
jgi:uncharacterized delta-60 repeat protein